MASERATDGSAREIDGDAFGLFFM